MKMARRSQSIFDWILLLMAVSIAASFAWLFYDQHQRSNDNKIEIAHVHHAALLACQSDRKQALALRDILTVFRDQPPPHYTPPEIKARREFFNKLITTVPIRNCKKEIDP